MARWSRRPCVEEERVPFGLGRYVHAMVPVLTSIHGEEYLYVPDPQSIYRNFLAEIPATYQGAVGRFPAQPHRAKPFAVASVAPGLPLLPLFHGRADGDFVPDFFGLC